MQAMCGADLSDLEEEKPRDREGNPRKKPARIRAKISPSCAAFPLLAT